MLTFEFAVCKLSLCFFVLACLCLLMSLESGLGFGSVHLSCLDFVFGVLELGLVVLGGSVLGTLVVLLLFSESLLQVFSWRRSSSVGS